MRKAALEIGVDRQIDRAAKRGEMLQTLLEGDAVVGLPIVQAKPALVEAIALKPRCCSALALPTSKGFGSTKHPVACIFRNVARLSAVVDTGMILSLVDGNCWRKR